MVDMAKRKKDGPFLPLLSRESCVSMKKTHIAKKWYHEAKTDRFKVGNILKEIIFENQ